MDQMIPIDATNKVRLRRRLYAVHGHHLPVPVAAAQAAAFAAALWVSWTVFRVLGIPLGPRTVVPFLAPSFAAFALTNVDRVEGRTLGNVIRSRVAYFLSPRSLVLS